MAAESAPTFGFEQTRIVIREEHTHRTIEGVGPVEVEVRGEASQQWDDSMESESLGCGGPSGKQISLEKWPQAKQISTAGGVGIKRAD